MHTIKPNDLETLIGNQALCCNDAPVTTNATFKLSELKKLIKEIENHKNYDPTANELVTHYICITFVRESIGEGSSPYLYNFSRHIEQLKEFGIKKGEKYYSQLIPIITGCICKLGGDYNGYKPVSFEYLSNNSGTDTEVISFVRSGGEGTGLIPPPPPGK